METPSTPHRVRDPIEDYKQSLSTKWGLRLPSRPRVLSPSKRDNHTSDSKIYNCIRFLYYHKSFPERAGLNRAIAQFEQEAPAIRSEWRFKPQSEVGVVPSRRGGSLSLECLQHPDDLNDDLSGKLVTRLESILNRAVDEIRHNRPNENRGSPRTRSAASNLDPEQPPTTVKPLNQSQSPRQMSYRGSSRPQSTSTATDMEHPLSDGFSDSQADAILKEHPMPGEKYEVQDTERTDQSLRLYGDTTKRNDHFVTPPTSPLRNGNMRSPGLSPTTGHQKGCDFPHNPFSSPQKKRGRAESPLATSRNLRACPDDRSAKPEANITSFRPLDWMNASVGMTQALSESSSCPSSMTSTVSVRTTPNTSFMNDTRNTSFDSIIAPIDTTVHDQYQATWVPRTNSKYHLISNLQYEGSEGVNGMNLSDENIFKPRVDTTEALGLVKKTTAPLPDIFSKLRSSSPFASCALVENATVPFRQVYEVCRVAQATKIPITAFSRLLQVQEKSYSVLWSSLSETAKLHNQRLPDPSSSTAWERAINNFQGVSLNAKLSYTESAQSSSPVFEVKYLPMIMAPSYRLGRHYGADRFLVLAIPGLGAGNLPTSLKAHAATFLDAFVKWIVGDTHRIFGRKWRAFSVKPESSKKKQKVGRGANDVKFRIFLFAEDGQGFRLPRSHVPGEIDPRRYAMLDRSRSSVQDMIEWFMPFHQNQEQQCLKFYERLKLGLSQTVNTTIFKPTQIYRADDAFADSPCEWRLDRSRSDAKKTGRAVTNNKSSVMNDGCARISKLAASQIAAKLDLGYIPSVFQGRIGGAKGVWMVDNTDEVPNPQDSDGPLWIEITDSQQKFEASPIDSIQPDPDRVTFEVSARSTELYSSSITIQLIPILHDRGVPREVFEVLLDKDLSRKMADLEAAMGYGLELRKWCHSTFPITTNRMKSGGVEMLGGLPESKEEKIIWFIDHGFEPATCGFLKDLLFKAIKGQCLRMENYLRIDLDLSTYALMIADPSNVLEENEVHIGFSRSFKDAQGFDQSMLHGIDVLVARLPAHLPSDIQKVRAVFKAELRIYRDVIVFSSRGNVSLASKLSGGDYDGDKAWICWEPCIVGPFQSAEVPEQPPPEFYGIAKDTTKVSDLIHEQGYVDRFLMHAFKFNLQNNLLGKCTNYHEALCYARNSIDSPATISLALLAGHLVDGPKNGFRFGNSEWAALLKKLKQPQQLVTPAYKDRNKGKPTNHLIDDLVFNVARKVREEVLGSFDKRYKVETKWDDDLARLHKQEYELAKSDPSLLEALARLAIKLDKMVEYWKINCPRIDDDNDEFAPNSRKKDSTSLSFDAAVEQCRKLFLDISPSFSSDDSDNNKQHPTPPSPKIQQWTLEHKDGIRSQWDLVKASVLFYRHHLSKAIWYAAGLELGELKATAGGRGSYRTVITPVYEVLKPDARLVDAARRRMEDEDGDDVESLMIIAGGASGAGGDGGGDDDDDVDDYFDEGGGWGWGDGLD